MPFWFFGLVLDLLFLGDFVSPLRVLYYYISEKIASKTFWVLTYVRLEKILSGTKFPARSFRTLVCESGLPARARKNSSSISSSLSSSASSSAPIWVVGGGRGMTMARSRSVPRADIGFFPLSHAKLLHFMTLNCHTLAR